MCGQARPRPTVNSAALALSPTLTAALILALLFLATALVGVWAAYDRTGAWRHFGSIAGGLVVAMMIAWAGRRFGPAALGRIAVICALLAALISLYFFLTNDWTVAKYDRFPLQQQAGLWLQAHRPAIAGISPLNPNTIAGGLLVTLPLGLGGALWAWQQDCRRTAIGAGLALVVGLVALLLSASRAGWLLLWLALLAAAYLEWRRRPVCSAGLRRLGDGLLGVTLLLVLVGFGAALLWPDLESLLEPLPRGRTLIGRIGFWRDSLLLIGDYPLTGSGLGSTEMIYSSYVLLIHVGYIDQTVHNLLLQVGVAQGLPGLALFLALLGMVIGQLFGWYRHGARIDWLRAGAAAALLGLLLQGLGEAGNYDTPMALVGFIPSGFILGSGWSPAPSLGLALSRRWARRWLPSIGGALLLLLLIALLLPGPRAALRANLGSVAQTRTELSVYQWPEWPIQDAVRRSREVELAPAIAHYRAALALDPDNVAANRRLGQIELSLGDYNSARQHLETAFAAAPHQRPTRLLLGESYALAGEIDQAVALWQSARIWPQQVALRRFWYRQVGDRQQRANLAEVAAGLGEP